MQLLVVYDNYPYKEGLKTDWGFGCVIRLNGRTVLFDTGTKGAVLLHNMSEMDVDPKEIDMIALSHIHWDHVGGLENFLEINSDVDVYVPASFPDSFKASVKQTGARLYDVTGPAKLAENIYSTGDLEGEAGLAVDTERGLIVITGCAHPGVVRLIERAVQAVDRPVELVIGGFHLLDKSDKEIASIIADFRRLGVRTAAPTHCTGDKAKELFREDYKKEYLDTGVGWRNEY